MNQAPQSITPDPALQRAQLALLQKQADLADLQAEELLRNKVNREEAERIQRAARDGIVADFKAGEAKVKAQQDGCSHRKPAPSHDPAIAGQRDHQQHTHYICLFCGKEWGEKDLPLSLRISGDRVGGPQL